MNKSFNLLGKACVSSKNGKRICRGRLINNQRVMEYKDWAKPILGSMKTELIENINEVYPVRFHFTFIFPDNRRRDLANFIQVIADLFVEVGIIPDDNYKVFWPVFDEVKIDKNTDNCGVTFWIEN